MAKVSYPRKKIDIYMLPECWQWVIALIMIGGISLTAWLMGRENPPSNAVNWIMDNLTVLGVVSLLLIAFGVYQAWRARSR